MINWALQGDHAVGPGCRRFLTPRSAAAMVLCVLSHSTTLESSAIKGTWTGRESFQNSSSSRWPKLQNDGLASGQPGVFRRCDEAQGASRAHLTHRGAETGRHGLSCHSSCPSWDCLDRGSDTGKSTGHTQRYRSAVALGHAQCMPPKLSEEGWALPRSPQIVWRSHPYSFVTFSRH